MRYKIVSVRDRAVDTFGQPVFVVAHGQAIRSFADEVKTGSGPMNKHPEDYDLYALGEFDDDTGLFETHVPRQIAVGKDFVG